MEQHDTTTPVARVVAKFGSKARIAGILKISRSAVGQWKSVPDRYHPTLLQEAAERGIQLQPWELTMLPAQAAALGLIAEPARAA